MGGYIKQKDKKKLLPICFIRSCSVIPTWFSSLPFRWVGSNFIAVTFLMTPHPLRMATSPWFCFKQIKTNAHKPPNSALLVHWLSHFKQFGYRDNLEPGSGFNLSHLLQHSHSLCFQAISVRVNIWHVFIVWDKSNKHLRINGFCTKNDPDTCSHYAILLT